MMLSVAFFLLGFSRQSKKTRFRFFQTSLIIFVITLFEVAALLYFRIYVLNASDMAKYNFGSTQYWVEDKDLGYKPRPSTLIRAKKKTNDKLIYDADYTFTSDGLRTTKSNNQSKCSFLFFGGARVFGEGLADIQTLPYQFSSKLNYNFNVLNYAFQGYGPHHMLRMLETGDSVESEGKIEVIFYLLTPNDINKITGNLEHFRRGPKYIIKNGEVKYAGDLTGVGGIFNSPYDFKNSVISISRHSQLINLVLKYIIDDAAEKNGKHHDLLSNIIIETNRFAREKYNSKLLIILNNGDNVKNNLRINLAANNIDYIETSDLLSQDWGEHYYLQDGVTFNEKVNSELAAGLANRYGNCN